MLNLTGGIYLLCFWVIGCAMALESNCGALERRVRELIWEIGVPNSQPTRSEKWDGKQIQLLKVLEGLGRPAVPFIIKHMDDRRLLPYEYMKLDNDDPNAFEAFRQYNPLRVVDALAGILNQLTGANFGMIYRRGWTQSEEARDQAVAGWQRFLKDNQDSFSCKVE
jgi:hypothetical protein